MPETGQGGKAGAAIGFLARHGQQGDQVIGDASYQHTRHQPLGRLTAKALAAKGPGQAIPAKQSNT